MGNDPPRRAARKLVVLTRYPEPGRAKTRLIPALGPEGAAVAHAEMVRHTLETVDAFARSRPEVRVSVWYAGGDRARFEAFLGHGRDYRPQSGADLGARMNAVFTELCADGATVVAIGTDCPDLSPGILREAFDAFDGDGEPLDLVLGPATDGGYYLIGLRAAAPTLFDSVPWGTSEVRGVTLARAEQVGLSVRLLEALHDVDEPADLAIWYRSFAARTGRGDPWLSVVIPALNEDARIAETVASVLRPGVEVIVADGGSGDGTRERALESGAIVIPAPAGRGPQLNAGAAAARGEALVFLHADTRLPTDYPEIVRRTLATPRVSLGAFRLRIDRPGIGLRLVEAGVRALLLAAAAVRGPGPVHSGRDVPVSWRLPRDPTDGGRRARRSGTEAGGDPHRRGRGHHLGPAMGVGRRPDDDHGQPRLRPRGRIRSPAAPLGCLAGPMFEPEAPTSRPRAGAVAGAEGRLAS